MENKRLGKILWWSEKDQNGVIFDSFGNEYYFDRSVLDSRKLRKPDRGALVIFEPSKCDQILVAKAVAFPNPRSISKYEEKFEQIQNQLVLPFAI